MIPTEVEAKVEDPVHMSEGLSRLLTQWAPPIRKDSLGTPKLSLIPVPEAAAPESPKSSEGPESFASSSKASRRDSAVTDSLASSKARDSLDTPRASFLEQPPEAAPESAPESAPEASVAAIAESKGNEQGAVLQPDQQVEGSQLDMVPDLETAWRTFFGDDAPGREALEAQEARVQFENVAFSQDVPWARAVTREERKKSVATRADVNKILAIPKTPWAMNMKRQTVRAIVAQGVVDKPLPHRFPVPSLGAYTTMAPGNEVDNDDVQTALEENSVEVRTPSASTVDAPVHLPSPSRFGQAALPRLRRGAAEPRESFLLPPSPANALLEPIAPSFKRDTRRGAAPWRAQRLKPDERGLQRR